MNLRSLTAWFSMLLLFAPLPAPAADIIITDSQPFNDVTGDLSGSNTIIMSTYLFLES